MIDVIAARLSGQLRPFLSGSCFLFSPSLHSPHCNAPSLAEMMRIASSGVPARWRSPRVFPAYTPTLNLRRASSIQSGHISVNKGEALLFINSKDLFYTGLSVCHNSQNRHLPV